MEDIRRFAVSLWLAIGVVPLISLWRFNNYLIMMVAPPLVSSSLALLVCLVTWISVAYCLYNLAFWRLHFWDRKEAE